ncbi:hypothetical protein [Variovorax sp. dw_954]|uniref:hypothetical protein n=1 Tax=Variovorax sp. dw_954 TaxID=2720078 RepID=UPI001BD3D5FD|nr:hypothetical protein [Variovorax sp. dw_954]
MNHEGSTFLSGAAQDLSTLYCAKEGDRLAQEDRSNSTFITYQPAAEKQWDRYKGAYPWTAIAMATTRVDDGSTVVIAISPAGDYWELDAGTAIPLKGKIPKPGASLRALRTIERRTFAVGMGRKVLEREGPGQWTHIGPVIESGAPKMIVGFEDMDGFGGEDLYAVGWRGEVWRRTGWDWRVIDSPTSTNLNAVCCASNGIVYIAGDKGVFMVGREDQWSLIETNRRDTLQDVAESGGRIYCVTDFEILTLRNNQLVPDDAFVDDRRPATCLHLVRTPTGLYSLGPKDVFVLRDGVWNQIV